MKEEVENVNTKCKQFLTMTSVASKTDHQIHKNCTEQDPNESYAGARTDPSEKIFAHTPKNEPSLHSSRFYQIYDYDDISWC